MSTVTTTNSDYIIQSFPLAKCDASMLLSFFAASNLKIESEFVAVTAGMATVSGFTLGWGERFDFLVFGELRWMGESGWMHRLRRAEGGGVTAYSASAPTNEMYRVRAGGVIVLARAQRFSVIDYITLLYELVMR